MLQLAPACTDGPLPMSCLLPRGAAARQGGPCARPCTALALLDDRTLGPAAVAGGAVLVLGVRAQQRAVCAVLAHPAVATPSHHGPELGTLSWRLSPHAPQKAELVTLEHCGARCHGACRPGTACLQRERPTSCACLSLVRLLRSHPGHRTPFTH